MIKTSHFSLVAAGGVLAAGLAASAAAEAPDEGRYVSAAELKAMVAKTANGLAIASIPTGPGATVLVARRDKEGEVEVHDHLDDEFVAQTATPRSRSAVSSPASTRPRPANGAAER